MSSAAIRNELTQQIINALQQGTIPWRKPWRTTQPGLPRNLQNRRYSGINVLLLSQAAMGHGYDSPIWGTYRSWQEAGAQVRKGQKSTKIVFYKTVKRSEERDGETVEKQIPLLRTYSVFNLSQVEGEKVDHLCPKYETQDVSEEDADWSIADALIKATHADIRHGESQAYYAKPIGGEWPHHTAGDYIGLPVRDRFIDSAAYYSTVFHEMGHWSEVRVGWTGSYAMGELVAEMASCFVASELGLPQSDDLSNHAAYLQSWLRAMNDDPKFIFAASTQASKVVDFLLSHVASNDSDQESVAATEDAHQDFAAQVQV